MPLTAEHCVCVLQVAVAFPQWKKHWSRVRVRYYRGKPYEVDDLLKVAVYAAQRVIVLAHTYSTHTQCSAVSGMEC